MPNLVYIQIILKFFSLTIRFLGINSKVWDINHNNKRIFSTETRQKSTKYCLIGYLQLLSLTFYEDYFHNRNYSVSMTEVKTELPVDFRIIIRLGYHPIGYHLLVWEAEYMAREPPIYLNILGLENPEYFVFEVLKCIQNNQIETSKK